MKRFVSILRRIARVFEDAEDKALDKALADTDDWQRLSRLAEYALRFAKVRAALDELADTIAREFEIEEVTYEADDDWELTGDGPKGWN